MLVLMKLFLLVCKRIAQRDLLLQNAPGVLSSKGEEVHYFVRHLSGVVVFFRHVGHSEQTEDCTIAFSSEVEEGAVSRKGPQNM